MFPSALPALLCSLLLAMLAAACGGDGKGSAPPGPDPMTEEFTLDEDTQAALDRAEAMGRGATGSYAHDDGAGTLDITLTQTSFECEGPTEATTFTATLTELGATTMVWELMGDVIRWTRRDQGEGTPSVVGVWANDDIDDFFLIIRADGTASLVGLEDCPMERTRNGNNCVELLPAAGPIIVDGDLSDWEAAEESARSLDPEGDQSGDDAGSDIASLSVAMQGERLYVAVRTFGPLSQNFQARETPLGGSFRLHLQDAGGDHYLRVAYSPEAMSWRFIEAPDDPSAELGSSGAGLEFGLDAGRFADGPSIPLIRFEARDCGTPGGGCQAIDELDDCGFIGG